MNQTLTLQDYRTVESALGLPDLKQSLYDAGKKTLMNNVLVTLHGQEHRERRMLEMEVFRRDFFRFFEQQLLPELLDEALAGSIQDNRLELITFGYRLMIHLAIAFAGIDRIDRSEEESDLLIHIIRTFGQAATLGQLKDGNVAEIEAEISRCFEIFRERFFQPSVARRELALAAFRAGEIAEDALPRDVLTVLLRNEKNIDIPADIILNETAFFFLAGAHTSVHSLGHIMHHLLAWCEEHPQTRAQLEADKLLVQRFALESFRLHPSSPIAQRVALAPTAFKDGQVAQAGDTVVIDLQTANRQQALFGEDADTFNPYRSLPTGIPPHGVTFGLGVHSCLGKNLAAGVVLRPGQQADPDNHQFGTVATIAHRLLTLGARVDPNRPAQRNQKIARETWELYPLLLDSNTL